MAIYFSNADIDFSLNDEPLLKKWIAQVIKNHSMRVGKSTISSVRTNMFMMQM